jgi:enoyl-CoA hydratase/carnithine racemase
VCKACCLTLLVSADWQEIRYKSIGDTIVQLSCCHPSVLIAEFARLSRNAHGKQNRLMVSTSHNKRAERRPPDWFLDRGVRVPSWYSEMLAFGVTNRFGAADIKESLMASVTAVAKPAQIRVAQRSHAYWRVTIDNPPINVMGPEMLREFQEVIGALERDEHVRVVVFDSAVKDYFLNHSDFTVKLEDLTAMPAGPTGLAPWPDFLVRLTRLPVASIALIRGRATGNGSEITLACDMSFASREKTIISQWEVGVGMVAGGGPMARLPRLIGRNRALEVLLSSEDIRGEQAETYGYVNRALPDADLDAFVETLATRIAKFDKWAIANTKRLVNTSLPPDVELGAGWDACIASLGRPAAQEQIKALMARGFHKPGDVENRLGYYLGEIAR